MVNRGTKVGDFVIFGIEKVGDFVISWQRNDGDFVMRYRKCRRSS